MWIIAGAQTLAEGLEARFQRQPEGRPTTAVKPDFETKR
jgi:hypothetical protein